MTEQTIRIPLMMRSTLWMLIMTFAGALILAGVVNLFLEDVSLAHSIGEFILAAVIIGLYLLRARKLAASTDSPSDT